MADDLRPVPIQELKLLAEGRSWQLDQHLGELESLTPVRGAVRAIHRGNLLEVEGEAATIVTLCCDRCLQHFNHALRAEVHELVELRTPGEAATASDTAFEAWNLELAREGMPEGADLDDRLDPAGNFDPERWLFEQLSLRMPLVNRCGDDCPGPATWSSEPAAGDPRWAALARLGLNEEGTDATAAASADASDANPADTQV